MSVLERSATMYREGLALVELGRFADHDGFDGVMLGADKLGWHLELTRCRTHAVTPSPTPEDLIVLYVPSHEDWTEACARMTGAGFRAVTSFNPYWEQRGRTFEDPDGYRIVLQRAAWPAS